MTLVERLALRRALKDWREICARRYNLVHLEIAIQEQRDEQLAIAQDIKPVFVAIGKRYTKVLKIPRISEFELEFSIEMAEECGYEFSKIVIHKASVQCY